MRSLCFNKANCGRWKTAMRSALGHCEPVCMKLGWGIQSFLIETIPPTPEMKARLSSSNARRANEILETGSGLRKL